MSEIITFPARPSIPVGRIEQALKELEAAACEIILASVAACGAPDAVAGEILIHANAIRRAVSDGGSARNPTDV